MFQTPEEQTETLRWAVLATHLNGAADRGKYDHIDTRVVLKHVSDGDVFEFLRTELGTDVEYALDKLTDVHRQMLLQHWLQNRHIDSESKKGSGRFLRVS